MTQPIQLRVAFMILLVSLFAMRGYFMFKVRRAGERLLPDKRAVAREGGPTVLNLRIVAFLLLITLLVMYMLGAIWIDGFSFSLPARLRWAGFGLGMLSLAFWTWTQAFLDMQWSAQLQLRKEHHLVIGSPYKHIRHPLYTAMFACSIALAVLTAYWIFCILAALTIAFTVARVPKEEEMMLETFGNAYKAYMQRTGRFFLKFIKE